MSYLFGQCTVDSLRHLVHKTGHIHVHCSALVHFERLVKHLAQSFGSWRGRKMTKFIYFSSWLIVDRKTYRHVCGRRTTVLLWMAEANGQIGKQLQRRRRAEMHRFSGRSYWTIPFATNENKLLKLRYTPYSDLHQLTSLSSTSPYFFIMLLPSTMGKNSL